MAVFMIQKQIVLQLNDRLMIRIQMKRFVQSVFMLIKEESVKNLIFVDSIHLI